MLRVVNIRVKGLANINMIYLSPFKLIDFILLIHSHHSIQVLSIDLNSFNKDPPINSSNKTTQTNMLKTANRWAILNHFTECRICMGNSSCLLTRTSRLTSSSSTCSHLDKNSDKMIWCKEILFTMFTRWVIWANNISLQDKCKDIKIQTSSNHMTFTNNKSTIWWVQRHRNQQTTSYYLPIWL